MRRHCVFSSNLLKTASAVFRSQPPSVSWSTWTSSGTLRTSGITSAFERARRLVVGQVLPQLGRLLVQVGEDPVEVAVGGEQLGRRLLPHAGHPRQVVRGVAAQRGQEDVLGGRHAGALDDPGLVVERVVAHPALVVEHPDMRVLNELEAVAVAGDHDDVAPAVTGLGGQCRQDVIRLEARCADDGDGQSLHDLADHLELRRQLVRRLGPPGLVVRDHLVAEGLARAGRRPRPASRAGAPG